MLHAQLPLPLAAQHPENTKEDARRAALRLIPADATGGLIASPRTAMLAASMEMLPVEIISAAGKQQLGFDPLDIEVLVGALEMKASVPRGTLVLRLRQPITLDTLPDFWKRGTSAEAQILSSGGLR